MPDYCYEDLFALSSDLMVVLDLNGRVVLSNNALLGLLGRAEQDVVGQSLVQFSVIDDRPRLADALMRVSHGGSPERIEVRLIAMRNESVRCDYKLQTSSGGLHILGVGRNLDDWYMSCNAMCMQQQALERLIDERTHEMKLAIAELEAFNLSISHDLRAPLRAINTFSQAISEDCLSALDDASRDYLRRISVNCERMMTLMDHLLQLSRLSHQELRYTTVDLGQMAEAIVADMRAIDSHRSILFSQQGEMVVCGDRALLFLLLQNLLDNAWKYTARRDVAIINFQVETRDGERVFSVSDNGAGFPASQYGRIFMLFHRLHSPEEYDGMGIGLATAQRVVQRHGGRIWAESIEGAGACFYFTLQSDGTRSLAPQARQE